MFRKSVLLLSALALVQATSAQAIQDKKTCLPKAQVESTFLAVLPTAIESVQSKCAPVLPATSAMMSADISEGSTIRMAADAAMPQAASALQTLFSSELKGQADPEVFAMLSNIMVGTMVKQEIKQDSCADIESVYAPLASLPPEKIAALTAAILVLVSKDEMRKEALPADTICF